MSRRLSIGKNKKAGDVQILSSGGSVDWAISEMVLSDNIPKVRSTRPLHVALPPAPARLQQWNGPALPPWACVWGVP